MTRQEFTKYVEGIYKATRGLIQLTPENKFNYKPMDGVFTVDQVIKHSTSSLGSMASMCIHNSWPKMSQEDMLPSAEKSPRVASIKEAIEEIDKDWQQMKDELGNITDDEFNVKMTHAPWMPGPVPIAELMMLSLEHLSNHRYQLFIWLKLSGEKLNTMHLYGMS